MQKNAKVFLGKLEDVYVTTINDLSLLVAARDPLEAAVVRAYGDYPDAICATLNNSESIVNLSGKRSVYSLVVLRPGVKTSVACEVIQAEALDSKCEVEENLDGSLRLL